MNLGIVGTGAMGSVLFDYALQEGTFENIFNREVWLCQRIINFISIKHVSFFHVIRQKIRRILIVSFAIVRSMHWGNSAEEIIPIWTRGSKIVPTVWYPIREPDMSIS